jgi:hypothetical protein
MDEPFNQYLWVILSPHAGEGIFIPTTYLEFGEVELSDMNFRSEADMIAAALPQSN